MAKWIAIEDQLPLPYEQVLLWIPSNYKWRFECGAFCVGSYHVDRKCFVLDSICAIDSLFEIRMPMNLLTTHEAYIHGFNFEPSHWQELPDRPYLPHELEDQSVTK